MLPGGIRITCMTLGLLCLVLTTALTSLFACTSRSAAAAVVVVGQAPTLSHLWGKLWQCRQGRFATRTPLSTRATTTPAFSGYTPSLDVRTARDCAAFYCQELRVPSCMIGWWCEGVVGALFAWSTHDGLGELLVRVFVYFLAISLMVY